jgi:hypothetical protein
MPRSANRGNERTEEVMGSTVVHAHRREGSGAKAFRGRGEVNQLTLTGATGHAGLITTRGTFNENLFVATDTLFVATQTTAIEYAL